MKTIQKINLQDITKLPVKEVCKTDGVGELITIDTPHKGKIYIDYKEETGLFTRTLKDKLFGDLVNQIQKWVFSSWM